MRRLFSCLALSVGLHLVAQPQPIPSVPNFGHVAEIWRVADQRLERQGDRWFAKGDFPRAAQILLIRSELYPDNYDRITDLGFMYKNLEMRAEELAVYVQFRNRMLAKDPDAAFPEANFYNEMKMFAKVIPLIEPTLPRHPHANSYRILARAYEKTGAIHQAIRVLQLLISTYPSDAQAKVNLERLQGLIKSSG